MLNYQLMEESMKTRKNSITTNYIYNMMFQVLNLLLPFITTPYVSRVLKADNIGIYSYTYSIITTFVLVGSLGVATYGQKEIAAVGEDKQKRSQLFWEIACVKIIAIMISSAVYFIMLMSSGQYMLYFAVQFPYLISAVLDISWFYQGIEDFKYVAVRGSFIKILSAVFIFMFVRTHDDLIKYLLILCLSQLVGNIPMWIRLRYEVLHTHVQFRNLKRHIKPTMVYFIPSIATQIYAVLDKAMLGFIVKSNDENGYYEQAHKIVNMTMSVVTAYTVIMRSRMSYLFAQKQITEIKKRTRDSLHFICMLVFPMGFGLAGIAKNFVPWFFGQGYDKVVYILYAFCPLYVLLGICTCIGTHILTPSGRQNMSNVGQVVGAAVNLILNAVLIPVFNSIGAAIASTTTELVILLIYLLYSRDYVNIRDILRIARNYFVAAFGMYVLIVLISFKLKASLLNSVILATIGGSVYALLLVMQKDSFFCNKLSFMLNKAVRRNK